MTEKELLKKDVIKNWTESLELLACAGSVDVSECERDRPLLDKLRLGHILDETQFDLLTLCYQDKRCNLGISRTVHDELSLHLASFCAVIRKKRCLLHGLKYQVPRFPVPLDDPEELERVQWHLTAYFI